jgi:hypothetical protein
MDPMTLVVAMGIPSAITGFFFWLMENRMKKRENTQNEERKKREQDLDARENAREKNELYLIKSVQAAIALGEATAKAVQRIPDAHCNGDMHAALDYAARIKHEQKDFLSEQALKQLY